MFSNVTDKQLELYRFEPLETISSSPKVRIDNRKSESSSIKNSSYMKTRFKHQDSESLSSTNITQHVNNNFKSKFNFIKGNIPNNKLNTQFKFTKGNISQGISPKLVPINNQITQVPSNESSSIWPSLNNEINTSSDLDWGNMVKNYYTNSMKSSVSRSSGSTSNAKIQHEVNSSKSSAYPPWGSISTVTTEIFLNTKKKRGRETKIMSTKQTSLNKKC